MQDVQSKEGYDAVLVGAKWESVSRGTFDRFQEVMTDIIKETNADRLEIVRPSVKEIETKALFVDGGVEP